MMINFNAPNEAADAINHGAAPLANEVSVFDFGRVQSRFAYYFELLQAMKNEAENHQVKDDETNEQAVEMATQAKQLANKVDKLRLEIVGPHKDFAKKVDSTAKSIKDPLDAIERNLKGKMSKYFQEREIARLEAERKAKAEAEALQKKLYEEAKKANVEPVIVAPAMIPQPKTIARTETGSASVRKVWTFDIDDPRSIPRDYMILDQQKVRAAIRAGIREIPGLRIFEETSVALRSA